MSPVPLSDFPTTLCLACQVGFRTILGSRLSFMILEARFYVGLDLSRELLLCLGLRLDLYLSLLRVLSSSLLLPCSAQHSGHARVPH